MQKTLLVLGASRGQTGLIKSAKKMGLRVEVATITPEKYPGTPLADAAHDCDISSKEEVLALVKKIQPDGIATACLDTGVTALGYAGKMTGLTALPYEAAVRCNDKAEMKEAFAAHGVSTARFRNIHNKEELSAATAELSFPIIIKATDLQGSKGIIIVRRQEDAESAFESVMSLTNRDYCIVEEFIEGLEFGAQAFIYQGEILFVLPHGDKTYTAKTAVPVGHSAPFNASETLLEKTRVQVTKAIKALGLDNCAVNVDLIERDGEVYLIELTGRVGANGLPEMTSVYFGLDYYTMIAAMAVGEDPRSIWETREGKNTPVLVQMLIETDKAGTLKSISHGDVPEENLVDLTFFVKPGDEVRKFTNSADCIGQLIVKAESLDVCDRLAEDFCQSLNLEVE